MPEQNSFGKRLRTLRKSKGLTQQKLADLVCVSFMTVRRWESGERMPRIDEIKQICEVLNVTETDLLNEKKSERWVLEIVIADDKEDFFNMTKDIPTVASINATPSGAYLQLGGSWEMFADEDKFWDLISQLDQKRKAILRTGKDFFNIQTNKKEGK